MEEDATKIAEDADSLVQHPAAWAAVARSRLEGFFSFNHQVCCVTGNH